ncbi:MAG TPA: insulinase family protein [Treponema sp.]|nr:insulinase family protein [Treponema sp.]
MKKHLILLFLVVGIFAVGCNTFGTVTSEAALANRGLETDAQVVTGTLENGLSWVVMENHEPKNRIFLRLIVRAGSVLEDEDQRGIAHLVEHMAFKGTESFDKEDLVDYFETIGMAFGPEVNAYTSFDETVYKLEIPADDPAVLDRSLSILAEWASSVRFDPDELERERGVVIEEWRLGLGAGQRVRDRQIPMLFRGSPYADRLPIGDPEVVRNLFRERIVDFYRDWYRPELTTVIAVGDVDPVMLEKKINEIFSPIPRSLNPRVRTVSEVPVDREPEILVVRDPEILYTTVQVLHHQKPASFSTVADYKRQLAEHIGLSVLNSRLSEKTLVADSVFLGAEAGSWKLLPQLRLPWLWMVPAEGKLESAFTELLVEFERMSRYGVTNSELSREKNAMLESMRHSWKNKNKFPSSSFIELLAQSILFNEPYISLDELYALHQECIPLITPQDINTALHTMYPGQGTLLFITAPEENANIPDKTTLFSLWESVTEETDIQPYQETDLDRPLFSTEDLSKTGSVVARHELGESGIIQLGFSNGVTVIFNPTSHKENEILFSAFSKGGTSLVSDDAYPSASVAVDFVEYSGLNGFDPISLSKKLSGRTVSLRPWIHESHEGFSGSSSKEDLETLMQLLVLYFTSPDFTETGWSSLMAQVRTVAENRLSRPDEQFNDMLKELLYGKAFRFSNMTKEFVDAMARPVAEAVYRDRFSDASDFVFVFTGSIDEESFTALTETYLGALNPAFRKEEAVAVRPSFPEGIITNNLRVGLEPKSTVFIALGGDEPLHEWDYDLFNQFRALLELRLREAIRETLGGSYGVGIGGVRSGYPQESFSLQIQFGCEPGREEELTHAVLAELTSLREEPVSEAVLTKLRENYRRNQETGLENNGYWHSRLVNTLMRGEPLSHITDTESVLSRISAETMQALALRYINPENLVYAWLLPAQGVIPAPAETR